MSTSQLRVYQLSADPAEQEQWLQWWGRIPALRERFGFRVVMATLDPDTAQFTWLVEHDGDYAAAEAEMTASDERADIFALARPTIQVLSTAFVRRLA